MANEELSQQEINHLYNLCAISVIAIFFIILAYFNYLMYTGSLITRSDYLLKVGLPFMILGPTAGAVTFEVCYHQKIRKTLSFHLKRFTGRMIIFLISAFWFVGVLAGLEPILSPVFGSKDFVISILLSLSIYPYLS